MTAPINLDLTTQQLADRVAVAITNLVAQMALRLAHAPAAPVTPDEQAAYQEMRAALHDMATTEYDRGYRMAMRGINRNDDGSWICPDCGHGNGNWRNSRACRNCTYSCACGKDGEGPHTSDCPLWLDSKRMQLLVDGEWCRRNIPTDPEDGL